MLENGALFHGRYRVVGPIKSGGAGAVYEVTDEVTGRRRALKVMLALPGIEAALRKRFAREAKITGQIESEHVVQVLDAGIDAGSNVPFIVMDLLRGEDLRSLSERRGPLPAEDVVRYLSQVALALEKTHAAGIVHRDLKPENLFLTVRDDGTPCVKVLDFGLAKAAVLGSHSERTAIVGTPLFMAPEQIRGEGTIGPRADIHALGHVAYALLAGEPYWAPEARFMVSVYVLWNKILAGSTQPPSARAVRRGVTLPPAFDGWFEKMTALSPEERPASAMAAVTALADALETPPPPSIRRDDGKVRVRRERESVSPFAPTLKAPPGNAGRRPPERRARRKEEESVPLFKDEQTQVYSERYLKIRVEEEYLHARKSGARLSAMLIALDVEERARGAAAPGVVPLADAVRRYAPEGVFVARHGADAIALLYPGAGGTRSRALAKVLGQRVEERLAKSGGKPVKVRVGTARLEKGDVSGSEILVRARRAMRRWDE